MSTATTKDYRKKRVIGGKKGKRKIGKVLHAVFHPSEHRIVGFIVKRPDFLLMIKRKDKFIAFDSFHMVDGRLVADNNGDAWDEAAFKRMGIDYDDCIIWENMDLRTEDGHDLGHIGEIEFSEETGEVVSITAADSATAKKLLGIYRIPADLIDGYEDGYIYLAPEAASIEASGGWAAKAGAASAKASYKASNAAKKTGEKIDDGAYKMGEAIGKAKKKAGEKQAERDARPEEETGAYKFGEALGKAKSKVSKYSSSDDDDDDKNPGVGGMFSAFKEEYKKNVSDDDR